MKNLVELDALEPAELAFEFRLAEAKLLPQRVQEVGIPVPLSRHAGRIVLHEPEHERKRRQFTRPPPEIARLLELSQPPVDHLAPIVRERAGHIGDEPPRFLERIVKVEETGPEHRNQRRILGRRRPEQDLVGGLADPDHRLHIQRLARHRPAERVIKHQHAPDEIGISPVHENDLPVRPGNAKVMKSLFMRRTVPLWKTPLPWVCLVMAVQAVLVVAIFGKLVSNRKRATAGAAASVPVNVGRSTTPPLTVAKPGGLASRGPAPMPTGDVSISLNDALGREWITATYRGNGRDRLTASLANRTDKALVLTVPSGLLFESKDRFNQVVVARGETVALGPGERRELPLVSAATRASNQLGQHEFTPRPGRLVQLDVLLTHLEKTPEVSAEAIQTAVLVILENPPVSTFAKFILVSGAVAAAPPPPAPAGPFLVATQDIIAALTLLKDGGIPTRDLLLAHEPQLKIESMIDPLAHADAMRYFGIAGEKEWSFWRDELLNGDVSTRHYALYGIARYFPDVALQMLPQWAREQTLPMVMRTAAINALAETGRIEAVSVLQQIAYEAGATTEIGQSAKSAIGYLENRRVRPAAVQPSIPFKDSSAPSSVSADAFRSS